MAMLRSAVPMVTLVMLLAALAPGSAAAVSEDGTVTVAAGGHAVLLDFTVAGTDVDDPAAAGNVRYLVYLDEGSEQDVFDVFVMPYESYQGYLAGEGFRSVSGWSSEGAGAAPAYNLVYLFEERRYVLLIDNSDVGGAPKAPAELKVRYQLEANNVEVEREPRWGAFLGLLALVALLGGAFLVGLSLYLKRRVGHVDAQRRKRCASCDKVSITDGRFCPYCGRER